MDMKKVGILPNLEKDTNLNVTKRIVCYLLEQGCMPSLTEEVAYSCGLEMYARKEEELFHFSDFLISLGGDGTLLSVGRRCAKHNVPILGINLGNLGFLTAEDKNYAERAIDQVLQGNYKVEKRMMLEASIFAEPQRLEGILALNDVCITRGFSSKILEFNMFVNDEYVDTLRADGVIICTPTGSTAYNLSAGGPILKGDADSIAITPICPHTLSSRSIIVSAEDMVTVEVCTRSDEDFTVSADGQNTMTLKRKNVVQIKKSEFYTTIIKTKHLGFYDVLRQKLTR
jgi:NAD+ kinase